MFKFNDAFHPAVIFMSAITNDLYETTRLSVCIFFGFILSMTRADVCKNNTDNIFLLLLFFFCIRYSMYSVLGYNCFLVIESRHAHFSPGYWFFGHFAAQTLFLSKVTFLSDHFNDISSFGRCFSTAKIFSFNFFFSFVRFAFLSRVRAFCRQNLFFPVRYCTSHQPRNYLHITFLECLRDLS